MPLTPGDLIDMRKLLIATALVAAALIGGAGCTAAPTTPSPSGPPPGYPTSTAPGATTPADAQVTSAVCNDAKAANATAFAALMGKYDEMQAAIKANDLPKLQQLADEGDKIAKGWEAKLAEFIAKQPKAEVAKALDDMRQLSTGDNDATANEIQAEFTRLSAQLTAACG